MDAYYTNSHARTSEGSRPLTTTDRYLGLIAILMAIAALFQLVGYYSSVSYALASTALIAAAIFFSAATATIVASLYHWALERFAFSSRRATTLSA